jgi:DNA-binding CsgD family transcriptional regulator
MPVRSMTERQWERRLLGYASLAAEEALSDSLLERVAKRVNEDYPGHVAFIRYDSQGRLEHTPVASGGVAGVTDAYERHWVRLNPYPGIVEQNDLGNRTAIMSRFLPRAKLWKTDYYNAFLRPLCVEYIIGMSMRFADRSRVSLSIYRGDHEGGEFDRTDVRRLDMLRPFLRQAVTLQRLWGERDQAPPVSVADGAADLAEPALLILQDGSVRPLNDAGERYLARHGASVALEKLLATRGGRTVLFRASELPGGSKLPRRSQLVVLKDDRSETLQRAFGLTPREADVTIELMGGLSNREVAARLGISVETCNSHVKTIHSKTGFGSTRRLIATLREIV